VSETVYVLLDIWFGEGDAPNSTILSIHATEAGAEEAARQRLKLHPFDADRLLVEPHEVKA